jgi:methylenetetrahydrofolate dehydrogenase (NADP+)/methenyltetrahydrofolate cyclohydrolase
MPAQLLKGKPIADKIKEDVKKDVEELKAKGVSPSLVAIQVGENEASRVYTNAQKKNAELCGIKYDLQELPADMTQEQLLKHIAGLNADPNVTGIILQMPVPEHIDATECQWSIAYEKDIEGVTPTNMGLVTFGKPRLVPCTAQGAFELIKSTGVDIYGKEVVVVGHSKGTAQALSSGKDTVSHSLMDPYRIGRNRGQQKIQSSIDLFCFTLKSLFPVHLDSLPESSSQDGASL